VVSLLGLGSAAAGGWLHRLHYPLLGLSILLVGVAFHFAYVRRPSRRSRLIAWGAALFTGTILAIRYL
jgi:hypothetical protein